MDTKKVQLLRVVGDLLKTEITDEEISYRKTEYPDEKKILKKTLACTSCGKDLKNRILSSHKVNVHPVLDVLWCKNCEDFYEDGNFSTDEDGSDKYCRWCAQGGELYCCSYCSVAFCSICVKRNLSRRILKDLDDDEWKCFVCVTQPLWPLRALCDAAKKYVDSHTKSRKTRRALRGSNEEEDEENEPEITSRDKKRKLKKAKVVESAESDENVFVDSKKSKRKHATNSDDGSGKKKHKRNTTDDDDDKEEEEEVGKNAKPLDPNEEKKEQFENIIIDVLNDCGTFRKIAGSKESVFKKLFLKTKSSEIDEKIALAETKFSSFFKDCKESIEILENKFLDQMRSLRTLKVVDQTVEKDDVTSEKADDLLNNSEELFNDKSDELCCENESDELNKDENTIEAEDTTKSDNFDSTITSNTNPDEIDNSSVNTVSVKETDGKSDETIPKDQSAVISDADKEKVVISENDQAAGDGVGETDCSDDYALIIDEQPRQNEKSVSESVNDSLFVNASSTVDSVKSDEFLFQSLNKSDSDKTIDATCSQLDETVDVSEYLKSQTTNNNVQENSESHNKVSDDENDWSAPKIDKENVAKMAVLQSSSDNETSKQKSSDSDLSGVSLLHSDEEKTV